MILPDILTIAVGAITGAVAGTVADNLLSKLKGEPAQNAFKKALGAAIHRYATRERLLLSRPLTSKDGLLSHPDVANELAQIVRFERDPDCQLIGRRWREELENELPSGDFTTQAELLVRYLEDELRLTGVFRPVFDSKTLDAIAGDAEHTAESLASVEQQLGELVELLDTRFSDLMAHIVKAPSRIQEQIYYFDRLVREKTYGFVGRQWLFDAMHRFVDENERGYFFIIGEPGIGKTTLVAQMVKQDGYIHHFNSRAEGISRASTFLRNVCAQLISRYELCYTDLPPEVTEDAGFLNKLLGEISNKTASDERCVIVIDALDEIDGVNTPVGTNLLCLPSTLPPKVYVIVTMRDDDRIVPRVDCERGELRIGSHWSENLKDVADFVQVWTARPGIQAYIAAQNIDPQEFIRLMVRRSEGNFMYLRYVMPEISSGVYEDRELDAIPSGLQNYYEDHWRRIRGRDEDAWFVFKLPVIVALTVVQEPVSLDLIKDFSKVDRTARIQAVLQEWSPFLYKEDVEYEGKVVRRYRLYHHSFAEFIATKQEVADERVDLRAMHSQIGETLWKDLFNSG